MKTYINEDKSIRLYNADCIEEMNKMIEKEIKVDLVVTSPPYFNVVDYVKFEDYDKFLKFMKDTFEKVYNILNEGRMCCVNISNIIIPRAKRSEESIRVPLAFDFVSIMKDIGFKFIEDIIWEKPSGAVPNRNGGFYRHRKPVAYKPNVVNEYIFIFQKPSKYLIDKILKQTDPLVLANSLVKGEYDKTNIWKINPETKSEHPAPFPIELSNKLVKYYSFVGDLVFDPFNGSGTTGQSCLNTGRRYIGTELHEKYFDISVKRLSK